MVRAGVRASVSCSNFGVRCSSNNKAWLLLQGHQWQSRCDSPPSFAIDPSGQDRNLFFYYQISGVRGPMYCT